MRRGRLELAVGRSLKAQPLTKADEAVSELARTYARKIDASDEVLPQVGRQFLETLMQLGLTPKARAGVVAAAPAASGLDELRARRNRTA